MLDGSLQMGCRPSKADNYTAAAMHMLSKTGLDYIPQAKKNSRYFSYLLSDIL